MDCNKDEATRAKEVAEKKLIEKDVMGAKKFALKAQKMYPGLKGIGQLIATLDVYLCAKNKIEGEPDWYGILGGNPESDDEALRRQYKKRALLIHPDKNKSVGADEAFKLVREAWSLLSDKARRLEYDRRTNRKAMHTASSTPKTTTSSVNTSETESNQPAASSSTSAGGSSKSADQSSNPVSSHEPKSYTFTTLCLSCKTWYQYSRVYPNYNPLCRKCGERFFTLEIPPPTTATGNPCGFWKLFQQANEKVTRRSEAEEAKAATKTEEAMGSKHHASKRASDDCSNEYANTAKKKRGMEDIIEID